MNNDVTLHYVHGWVRCLTHRLEARTVIVSTLVSFSGGCTVSSFGKVHVPSSHTASYIPTKCTRDWNRPSLSNILLSIYFCSFSETSKATAGTTSRSGFVCNERHHLR
mmetsp:Transcript_41198/g.60283  ORF Transcript_41198/g.60283 Transcript_41198/m.60283 type:complete len:108 (-) Transcript_41198:207-530(-)